MANNTREGQIGAMDVILYALGRAGLNVAERAGVEAAVKAVLDALGELEKRQALEAKARADLQKDLGKGDVVDFDSVPRT